MTVLVKVEDGNEVIVCVEVNDGVGRTSFGEQLVIVRLHAQNNPISANVFFRRNFFIFLPWMILKGNY